MLAIPPEIVPPVFFAWSCTTVFIPVYVSHLLLGLRCHIIVILPELYDKSCKSTGAPLVKRSRNVISDDLGMYIDDQKLPLHR